jgi:cytochrome b involved in lipid metabolism
MIESITLPILLYNINYLKNEYVVIKMKVVFENRVYDISDFISSHPGGKHVFNDLDNHDITPLVYSYHNNANKIKTVMKK